MTKQNDRIELTEGAETAAVVFAPPFAGAPTFVKAEVFTPVGEPMLDWALEGDPTAAGLTVRFAAPLPAAGYVLSWLAIYM